MREIMLILHFLGLAMGIGAGFAWLFIGRAGAGLEEDQSVNLRIRTSSLGTMAHIGILILIVSGGYLMTPFWSTLGQMPMLIMKLSLVLVFGAFLGITAGKVKKLKKEHSRSLLRQAELFSMLSLLTGVIIVVLAVLVFR